MTNQNGNKIDDIRLVVFGYHEYNIVHCQGLYYGWPWPAGEFSLEKFRSGGFPAAVVGASVIEAKRLINARLGIPDGENQSKVSTNDRFLVIKSTRAGFWSDMHNVWAKLLLAEITNRCPIVYWGEYSLYSVGENVNSYEKFFLPVADCTINDVIDSKYSYYPSAYEASNIIIENLDQWSWDHRTISSFIESDANVLVCATHHCMLYDVLPWVKEGHPVYGMWGDEVFHYIIGKYTRLQPYITDEIEQFYHTHDMGKGPVLAVHIRSSDRIIDVPHLNEINALYPAEINQYLESHPSARIFLLTEDEFVLELYKQKFGDILIYTDCNRKMIDNLYPVFQQIFPDRIRKGIEVIKDVYLACKCDAFLGNQYSNVSLAISRLKKWEPGKAKLLWKPMPSDL